MEIVGIFCNLDLFLFFVIDGEICFFLIFWVVVVCLVGFVIKLFSNVIDIVGFELVLGVLIGYVNFVL